MLPESSSLNGTSVFDPVLMEFLCKSFVPRPGHRNVRHRPVVVVDPFAGGVVRGWVAGALGLLYIGIDVSQRQVDANEAQVGPPMYMHTHAHAHAHAAQVHTHARLVDATEAQVGPAGKVDFEHRPCWIVGDGESIDRLVTAELERRGLEPHADALISCPPYYNLEEYRAGPNDLSGAPTYEAFLLKYKRVIANAVKLLRHKALSVFVVGDVRDRKTDAMYTLHHDTVGAFKQAGCAMHQDAVLTTAIGTGAMRATKTMSAGAKLVNMHQNVVICVKGDGFTPADARAAGVRPNEESLQSQ